MTWHSVFRASMTFPPLSFRARSIPPVFRACVSSRPARGAASGSGLITAAIGLVIGVGLYVKHTSYQASTTVVLVPNPVELPTDAILTDIALAQSQTVAGLALRELGLRQSAGSFVGSYKVIRAHRPGDLDHPDAPSSSEAVARAQAVANAFLKYRAQQSQAQLQHTLTCAAAAGHPGQAADQGDGQPDRPACGPALPRQHSRRRLSSLHAQRSQAESQLPALQQAVTANQVNARLTMTQMVQGSQVLDPASPKPPSHVKKVGEYVVGGLLAGLVLGMGLVIIRVLVSDRLRQRDDVAHALGVPVRLSVGRVHARRWPGRGGLAAAQDRNVQRIVAHLRDAVPQGSRRTAALALVAIDDASVAALALTALAVSCAQQGQQVVLADLCRGAPAARLLGAKGPGVAVASTDGAHLVVAVPPDTDAPAGPLRRSSPDEPSPDLAEAYASADLLLTIAQLDPSLGGDYLATWAGAAVVMVTAGQSSWAKIHAVGELIRLAGTPLISAVLVGADKNDESLGVAHVPATPATVNPGPRIPGR